MARIHHDPDADAPLAGRPTPGQRFEEREVAPDDQKQQQDADGERPTAEVAHEPGGHATEDRQQQDQQTQQQRVEDRGRGPRPHACQVVLEDDVLGRLHGELP